MYLIKLAFRNYFRNTRRSIISGISVAIAITAIIFFHSYIRGANKNIGENVINLLSGHIRITTKEYERRERLIPLSESIPLSAEFYNSLNNKDIIMVSPRIKFGVLLGKEEMSIPALGYAIAPEKEVDISGLDKRIIEGSYIAPNENAAILGKNLAARLNVKVGDILTIITKTAYDSPSGINLLVKGIFSTGMGGIDRSLFYIPLDVGQRLLDLEGSATEIVIIIKNPDRAVDVAHSIKSHTDYSVIPFQYNPILRYINSVSIVLSIFYFIVLLVACSTIANTMMMVVLERTKEIGMMKAMGLNNLSVVGLLTLEAGIIGFVGSLLGAIFGAILSYWLKYQGLDFSKMASSSAS
ncbi:MAG: FtsX-like permease family protein, partial [candidate division WOR-3 bacterium]|nr:FtsX-like permease family protein [candidate division WOR-3 bacterium]